jgi:hypothetical protein
LLAFLAAFFLVDRFFGAFLAAFRFFAIEYGSFRCSARFSSHGLSTGALTTGERQPQSKDNRCRSTNGWLRSDCRFTIQCSRCAKLLRAH